MIIAAWASNSSPHVQPATKKAAKPVVLMPSNFSAALAQFTRYFQDQERKVDLQQVLGPGFAEKFKKVPGGLIDFGFTKSRIWLQMDVRNASADKGQWILDLQIPYTQSMRVWIVRNSSGQQTVQRILRSSDSDPFAVRKFNYRNFAAGFSLDKAEQAKIIIAYSSSQATQLSAFVRSPDNFASHIRSDDVKIFTLFALLAGITLVTTLYLLAFNPKLAAIFCAYIAISGLYLLHTDGYAFQYLWPNSPEWNKAAVALIGMTMIAFGSLFGRAFVSAPENFPRLNRLLLFSISVSCTLAVLSMWFLDTTLFKVTALLFIALPIALQIAAGILALRHGRLGATMFLFGALTVIAALALGAIGYLNPGMMEQDIAFDFGRYALIVESMAFSAAMFLNIQSVRRDHDRALQREIAATREQLATSQALLEAHDRHDRALALAETRRQQLAATAHDIKQPLTSLRFAMLRMNADDEETARHIRESFDYLEDITRSNLEHTNPAQTHSNQPGTASSTETDSPSGLGARETFPVNVVLKNVHAMFRDEAASKGLELRLALSSINVIAEPIALMRMVSNLVSNAIKYTKQGRVLLGVRRNGNKAVIKIFDTGPGFSTEEAKHFIEPYQRGGQPGGTGLGLSVVSDLARQHGIEFDMASKPGCGTVCTLEVERAALG